MRLQLEIGDSEDGRNHGHVDVRPALINAIGVVHGGVTFSLIDQSMGAAMESVVKMFKRLNTV